MDKRKLVRDADGLEKMDRSALEKRVWQCERESRLARASVSGLEEELERYRIREDGHLSELESLRAKVLAMRGVRELATRAKREAEENQRDAKDWEVRAARAEADLEQFRLQCNKVSSERDSARESFREASLEFEAVKRDKARMDEEVRMTAAKLDDELAHAAVAEQKHKHTAESLVAVKAELAEARQLEHRLRETITHEKQCAARLEQDVRDAQRIAIKHRLEAMETDQLKHDVRRLVRLLASTSEYESLGSLLGRDSLSYVGGSDPTSPIGNNNCNARRAAHATDDEHAEREWATLASIADRRGASVDPLISDEAANWAPAQAVQAGRKFHLAQGLPWPAVKAFLRETNEAWLKRERKLVDRLNTNFQRRVDDIFRKTQHGLPYDKIRHDQEIARLKLRLRQVRTRRHLKGRPKTPVDRSLPNDRDKMRLAVPTAMSRTAKDNLLAASLQAIKAVAQASATQQSSHHVLPTDCI